MNDAEKAPAKKVAAKKSPAKKASDGLSADERAAVKARAAELRAQEKAAGNREAGEADVQSKIAELDPTDRALAGRLHQLVLAAAPELMPKTYYGMPAYARDGKVLCFFQPASKFKTRYGTFAFNDDAQLDDGAFWPTGFALVELTEEVETRITELVKRAVS